MPDTSALPPELVARIVQRVKEELARTESGAQQAAVPPLAEVRGTWQDEAALKLTLGAFGGVLFLLWLFRKEIILVSYDRELAMTLRRRDICWVVPRTADGRPDLQGVWANNTMTPLERPRQFGLRTTMTDAELTELKAKAQAMMDGGDAFFADELITAALEGKKLPSTT